MKKVCYLININIFLGAMVRKFLHFEKLGANMPRPQSGFRGLLSWLRKIMQQKNGAAESSPEPPVAKFA